MVKGKGCAALGERLYDVSTKATSFLSLNDNNNIPKQ